MCALPLVCAVPRAHIAMSCMSMCNVGILIAAAPGGSSRAISSRYADPAAPWCWLVCSLAPRTSHLAQPPTAQRPALIAAAVVTILAERATKQCSTKSFFAAIRSDPQRPQASAPMPRIPPNPTFPFFLSCDGNAYK